MVLILLYQESNSSWIFKKRKSCATKQPLRVCFGGIDNIQTILLGKPIPQTWLNSIQMPKHSAGKQISAPNLQACIEEGHEKERNSLRKSLFAQSLMNPIYRDALLHYTFHGLKAGTKITTIMEFHRIPSPETQSNKTLLLRMWR